MSVTEVVPGDRRNCPRSFVALREAIRTFIQREIAPKEAVYAQEITETGTFAALQQEKKALRKRSAAEGYYSLFMPEEAGGGGVGYPGARSCASRSACAMGCCWLCPAGCSPASRGRPDPARRHPSQQERYLQPTSAG